MARIGMLAGLAGMLGGSGVVLGQNFSLEAVRGDQAFDEGILPSSIMDVLGPPEEGYKGELRLHVEGKTTYNSNLFIGSSGKKDDVILSVIPSITYTTDPEGGAPFTLTAYYAPSILFYLDNSDLNRVNHSLGVSLNMAGAVTSVRVFADFRQNSGGDRFTGGFSNSSVLRFGAEGTRQIAPRTTLIARLTASRSAYSGTTKFASGAFRSEPEPSNFYAAELGAMWMATERIRIGPSVRYSVSDSDSSGTRTSVGLLVNGSYEMTDKINLAASVGPSFFENSRVGGSSGVNLALRLKANYRIDELWSARAAIRYGTIPSPGSRNYVVTDYQFSTSVVRQLNYGSLEAGVNYNFSDYQASGLTPVDRGNENFWSVFLGYHRNFTASERVRFNASLQYGSNDGQRNWSQWLFTAGLGVSF